MPVEAPGSETETIDGTTQVGEETDERWYRIPETELHPYIQHALANTFSGGTSVKWNEEWTKPEDLEGFLKGRLAPFFFTDYIDSLPWDELTDFGMIHMYHSILEPLWNEYWNIDSALDPWVVSLNEEFADADDLLSTVAAVPLVNEARLVEEFDYASIEEARDNLRAQVQYAYEIFDIRPPEDLHEWSVSELANEYYGLLTNVYVPYRSNESDIEDYFRADDFVIDFTDVNFTVLSPESTITRLDGSHRESPMELVFFVASFFIEPLDWALTAQEMVSAAEDEDWWQFFLSGVFGILPVVSGRVAKRLRNVDEVRGAARVSHRINLPDGFPGPYQKPGSAYIPNVEEKAFQTKRASTILDAEVNRAAAIAPEEFGKRAKMHTGQDMHHLVPISDMEAEEARDILVAKGIPPNSTYNGVALEPFVHQYATFPKEYVKAVNNAIRRFEYASASEVEEFLRRLSDQFVELNNFARFNDIHKLDRNAQKAVIAEKTSSLIIDWIRQYPYP